VTAKRIGATCNGALIEGVFKSLSLKDAFLKFKIKIKSHVLDGVKNNT